MTFHATSGRASRRGPLIALAALALACSSGGASVDAPSHPAREGVALARTAVAPHVPALPRGRHGHRLERLGADLVCLGGFGDARAADRGQRDVLRLAAGEREWRTEAPMPRGRAFFGSVAWGGDVYAIGGGVDRLDGESWAWDPWIPAGVLPDSHFGCAGAGGVAWVLGGYPLERSSFFRVDLSRRTVEALPPPPGFEPGDHFALLHVLDGALHVVGGLAGGGSEPSAAHRVLGPDGTWRTLPPAPEPLFAKFAVHGVLDGALVVHELTGTFRYTASDGWHPLAPPPSEQRFAMPATVTVDETLWALGGRPLGAGRPAHLSLAAKDLGWIDHRER